MRSRVIRAMSYEYLSALCGRKSYLGVMMGSTRRLSHTNTKDWVHYRVSHTDTKDWVHETALSHKHQEFGP